MIDLRVQLFELEQQIQALQPAFFAACLALNTQKIQRDRAIIKLFQQNYEPSSGRDVTWAIKLLLAQAQASSLSSPK